MQSAPKALIVLGMHRSGTSALAGQSARLGFWLGDDLLPPQPSNPKGFFEDVELMQANDRLVSLLFGGWASPLSWAESAAAMPLDHPRICEISEAIRGLLQRLDAQASIWAVKDPRISRLLPIWWPLVRAIDPCAQLIMALRHPAEVVASLARRDGLGAATVRLMWLRHVAEPLVYAHEQDLPLALMPYETLLTAPDRLAETLAAMGFVVRPTGEAFVDGTLRHHHYDSTPTSDESEKVARDAMCVQLYGTLAGFGACAWRGVPEEVAALARAARDLPAETYCKELYRESLGVSSMQQRLFYERRKESQQAQQRRQWRTLKHPIQS